MACGSLALFGAKHTELILNNEGRDWVHKMAPAYFLPGHKVLI